MKTKKTLKSLIRGLAFLKTFKNSLENWLGEIFASVGNAHSHQFAAEDLATDL